MRANGKKFISIRTPSGLSGDMLLTGLYSLSGDQGPEIIERTLASLKVSGLVIPAGCVRFLRAERNHVWGIQALIDLPHEHSHRSFQAITDIISRSAMDKEVRDTSLKAFSILARAEGEIHNIPAQDVTFHEVGALDSILDICLSSALFNELGTPDLICSPLPLADGPINMHHGKMFSPAPAVLKLLQGVPIYGVAPEGETVTPTAIALLLAFGARFDVWPRMTLEKSEIAYGGKIFKHLPNGAIFALGKEFNFSRS